MGLQRKGESDKENLKGYSHLHLGGVIEAATHTVRQSCSSRGIECTISQRSNCGGNTRVSISGGWGVHELLLSLVTVESPQ